MSSTDDDLEIRAWSYRYHDGQPYLIDGVVVLHKPSGLAVVSTNERSWDENKVKAVTQLRGMLAWLATRG